MSDQFSNAPDDDTAPDAATVPTSTSVPINQLQPHHNPRDPSGNQTYIDDPDLAWSEEEEEYESEFDSEDEREREAEGVRVDDEDWEIAEKDFTKQYNRLRIYNELSSGQPRQSTNNESKGILLPAINRPKPTKRPTQQQQEATEKKKALDKRVSDQLTALSKYSSRIANIDVPYSRPDDPTKATSEGDGFVLGVSVNRKGPSAVANQKDKADRATTEQVLDPRTRIILFKMIGRELVKEINGCVSTGKEANVYHALTPTNTHLALKIYKTSILVFKDRDRYVTGEFRFRRGYSRHNPRKMVRLWAEKEMRNLKRMKGAGVRCPEAVEVRENVLVMDFLGDQEGWPSPRLKDADIPIERYPALYHDLMLTTRTIYQQCKLVHADLSEYNILYHNDALWIIDVSQSVEHDHPSAFEFLRMDLKNVAGFFGGRGVRCLSLRRAFEFVTREGLDGDPGEVLTRWIEEEETVGEVEGDDEEERTRLEEEAAANKATEESVFLSSFIPRSLGEVLDPEKNFASGGAGTVDKLATTAQRVEEKGPTSPSKNVRFTGVPRQADETESEEDEDEDEDEEEKEFVEKRPRGHRHEDKEAKKERKKAVKEEQREKRKTKMPKAEKKKAIKKSRGG